MVKRHRPKTAPPSLQESILTALAFDDKYGAQIATQITSDHFDEHYYKAAELLLEYRREYHKPPGRAHLDDLFELAGGNDAGAEQLRNVLANLVGQADEGFNGAYVAGKVGVFVKKQRLKMGLLKASDRFTQDGDNVVPEVEQILQESLSFRAETMDVGLFLSDRTGLEFLDHPHSNAYSLRIPELDRRGIGPAPGQMLLYIAPKGSGKSWFAIHCGIECRRQRATVVHISLEMSQELCYKRYVQSLFNVAQSNERFIRSQLEYDDLHRLVGFRQTREKPRLSLTNDGIRKTLMAKMDHWGSRLDRLLIKAFPSGQLTVSQLSAYLDFLESTHHIVPNVLVIDYPDLMKLDGANYRHSLGQTYVDLRGLAVARNLALVCPTQGGRQTLDAKHVKSKDVSEDVRKINTADNVLTYSATPAERKRGLARLLVAHARDAEGDFQVLITQSYHTGQYVLESATMSKAYWDQMERVGGGGPDAEEKDFVEEEEHD